MGRTQKELDLIDEIIKYQIFLKEKYGFDWDSVSGVLEKLKEEIEELEDALKENKNKKIEEEFGDILITIVNLSRFLNLDLIDTLNKSYMKFKKRVDKMEKEAKKKNIDLEKLNIYELDKLWDKSKK
ncbi:MAG TPA: MazG nucleotide pyrophosphohydrolase domain-containing protein [Caldisericia bacterium]|nr:MazG nucleotide pyrophosphohydrolase domain-containing protein [Caldisericia bacterium]HPB33972.1 MazG nucleotide pyrophosphohydrolase domain-containing protein [Caldisericia bacterium]HQL67047.1 MazG nucleotide pyrophosphohydrolase domain-containing protein [Caldisericia bacterium]HQN48147.1 MazG nucleotide pyrophosphohydrolase domain-containing protein [Caldisericia bacterium]